MSFAWIAGAGAVIGMAHLGGYYAGARRFAGATKAVPIALLFVWVLAYAPVVGEGYRWLVAVGLLSSMAGDVLLISPERFRAGLAAFFLGHVLYAFAFMTASPGFVVSVGWLMTLAALAGVILRALWSHVAEERTPVVCYVVMISIMAWTSIGRMLAPSTPEPSGTLAVAGALVFMTSDATLAFDRFVRPWRGAHAAIMVTYYAAQILIAGSVSA